MPGEVIIYAFVVDQWTTPGRPAIPVDPPVDPGSALYPLVNLYPSPLLYPEG